MSTLSLEAVFALRRFRYDNTPPYYRDELPPDLGDPEPSDAEARDLILFAARFARAPGDWTPRKLEAVRAINLVPEDVGASLFGGAA